jgi:hypothetical protein
VSEVDEVEWVDAVVGVVARRGRCPVVVEVPAVAGCGVMGVGTRVHEAAAVVVCLCEVD